MLSKPVAVLPHFRLNSNYFLLAMLGATNPLASAPGTIRGDYAIVLILRLRKLTFYFRMLVVMFVMEVMLLRVQRRKLHCGSKRTNLLLMRVLSKIGCMSRFYYPLGL